MRAWTRRVTTSAVVADLVDTRAGLVGPPDLDELLYGEEYDELPAQVSDRYPAPTATITGDTTATVKLPPAPDVDADGRRDARSYTLVFTPADGVPFLAPTASVLTYR